MEVFDKALFHTDKNTHHASLTV